MFGFGFGFGSGSSCSQHQSQPFYPPYGAQQYYPPYGEEDFGQYPQAFPPLSESFSEWWSNQGTRNMTRESRLPRQSRNRPREGDRYDIRYLIRRARDSPCFRHDHTLLTQHGDMPFRAGDWELDRRHMIEVQFDHFGVASSCKSTSARGRPWRPEQDLFSTNVASARLQMEAERFRERFCPNSDSESDDYHFGGGQTRHGRQNALARSWNSGPDNR